MCERRVVPSNKSRTGEGRLQEMEMEDRKKDRERLDRYIVREQLVSVMNNTKWEKLRDLILELPGRKPRYRLKCLRADDGRACCWDGDWYYHLPTYKSIEWLDIDPIIRHRQGRLLNDKKTDCSQQLCDLLKKKHVPFSLEGKYIRVWGYQRPGQTIEFA